MFDIPIVDLHCDLLIYLALNKERSINDQASRCSLPLLKKGNVKVQTLAFFSQTQGGSSRLFEKQKQIFLELKDFKKISSFSQIDLKELTALAAIENASLLSEENEPLEMCFKRLDSFLKECGPILYISLTWNEENRFGGGNLSSAGLKNDGKALLEYLNNKNIAIDLSHTSDALAGGILNYIEEKNLNICPIASHSNSRDVMPAARNLPREYIERIIEKKGVIGINFVRKFLGENFIDAFKKHIDFFLDLGAEDHICLGADFFCDLDSPSVKSLTQLVPFFTAPFDNSSCYPLLVEKLKEVYPVSFIKKLCFENFLRFIKKEAVACL